MINIISGIFGSSGYCNHGRSLASALFKITKVRLTTNVMPGAEQEMTDAELEMIKRLPEENEAQIIIDLPFNWINYLKGDNNFCYSIWEGDKVPKSFIKEYLNPKVKQIWVASTHNRDAIVNTLKELKYNLNIDGVNHILNPIEEKIRIIPHGVDLSKFYPTRKI